MVNGLLFWEPILGAHFGEDVKELGEFGRLEEKLEVCEEDWRTLGRKEF